MVMILTFRRFAVHFPLSVFRFCRGRNHSNKLSRLHTGFCIICIIAASLFLQVPKAESELMENMAVDPVAMSLANSVTAYSPGVGSVWYNPAGLSNMADGTWISQGTILPIIQVKTSFANDPNLEPLHDFQGNVIKDPAAGKSYSSTSGMMYIPVIDTTLNFLVGGDMGFSYRKPGSNWTFGYLIYTPDAGGWVNGDADNPARYELKSMYLQHLVYFGPALSYRVNQNFSIGFSVAVGQTAMGEQLTMRSPNEMTNITKVLGDATQGMQNPIFDLMGFPMPLFGGGLSPYEQLGEVDIRMRDDFSPSYNVGALWEPYDWLSFGLSYNSAINSHMTGKYEFQYSKQWQNMTYWMGENAIMQIISMVFDMPYSSVASQTGTVTMDMEFPQMVNFGIKLKPFKRLTLLNDWRWANYSDVQQYVINFDQKIQLLQLAKFMGYNGGPEAMIMERGMKDTIGWSVGAEYQLLDWLSLRAGYEYRPSSCQYQYFDLMSISDANFYGLGLGIKGNALGLEMTKDADIDLTFAYMTT